MAEATRAYMHAEPSRAGLLMRKNIFFLFYYCRQVQHVELHRARRGASVAVFADIVGDLGGAGGVNL